MTNELDPKWKRFEKAVYEIQKQLAADSKVILNDSIKGIDSQTSRQIDISILRQIAQYSILIVIECKDYKDAIDIKTIEEFAGLVRDVRANKGAMIASTNFTDAALNYAKAHGIDTFRLVDTKSIDWKAYASVPVLLESTNFKSFRIIFKNFTSLPRTIETLDIKTLRLFSADNKLIGTIGKIIADKWNNGEVDENQSEKEVLIGRGLSLEIGHLRVSPIDVYARIIVEKDYFYGNLPIHLKGFRNLQSGEVITKEITTDSIEPYKIEEGLVEGWQKIGTPDDLAIKPFLSLSVKNHLPVEVVADQDESIKPPDHKKLL